MAPSLLLVAALIVPSRGDDETSMLQAPMLAKTLQADSDESECRCPGYYQEQCEQEAAQGCRWSDEGSSNGAWCQCLGEDIRPPWEPVTVAPPVALWTQHMGDAAKCNDNVDLQTVADQAACQTAAVAAGHAYYSFRHNPENDGLHKCMSSATCDSPLTGTNNEWNMYAGFTLVQTDMKCPHQSGDRLFRDPASGSSDITLEQCRAECLITAGCAHFSHGEHGGAYVCMGCTTLVNAQVHAGFNAYDMA